MSGVLLVRRAQGRVCGWSGRLPVHVRHHGHNPDNAHPARGCHDNRNHYNLPSLPHHPHRQGEQLRDQLPAAGITQALFPLLPGLHWQAVHVDMQTAPGCVWYQFCFMSLLPSCQDYCGSDGLPVHCAQFWSLEALWALATKGPHLVHYCTTGRLLAGRMSQTAGEESLIAVRWQ